MRRVADETAERATQIQVELAGSTPRPTRPGGGSTRRAADEPAEGDDRDELAGRVERLDARREALGKVNPSRRRSTRRRRSASRSS